MRFHCNYGSTASILEAFPSRLPFGFKFLVQVYAADLDAGVNGQVLYSLVHVASCPPDWFEVDSGTGHLLARRVITVVDVTCVLTISCEDQDVVETRRRYSVLTANSNVTQSLLACFSAVTPEASIHSRINYKIK